MHQVYGGTPTRAPLAAFEPLDVERWAAIPEHPGYEASSHGRVRVGGAIREPRANDQGYLRLWIQGRYRRVHRLVLQAFEGPCPDGMEGCHKDDNPANNNLSNLRWDTSKGNRDDRRRNHDGLFQSGCTHCPAGHPFVGLNIVQRPRQRHCRACAVATQMRLKRVADGTYDGDYQSLLDLAYRNTRRPAYALHRPAVLDKEHLAELVGIADTLTAQVRFSAPADDTNPCGGSACTDDAPCDGEFVVFHRAVGGSIDYRTPTCRGCVGIEIRNLRLAAGTDPNSVRVELPLPLVNQ